MRKQTIGNPAVYAKVRRCCVAITIAILGSGSASADNATVGNGTPGSCTESALNTALLLVVPGSDAPGGTLNFQCGPAPHTIALTSSKFLSDQVTIDGGGLITFDGQNLTRIFTLSVPNGGRTEVLLKDLTLARGFGGAILANGGVQLGLQNVMVRDSRAGLSGGAIAISPGGLLTVNGSRFERNRARDGGAIAASCDVQISGSVFFNNDAEVDQGGALQIWTSTLTASNTRFEFNAALNGGAVLQRGGTVTLNQAVFVDNQARDRGGAYHVYENDQATINGASFTGNTAVNDGGAVYVAGQLDAGVSNEVIGSRMQIVGSDLNGNSAQRAGGGAPGRAQRSGAPGRPGGVPRAARSDSAGSLGIPAAWVVPAVAGSSPCRCQGADQRPRKGRPGHPRGERHAAWRSARLHRANGRHPRRRGPALFGSTTTPPPSFNRSGTVMARAGPSFQVNLFPGKAEHGGWSWLGSRERGSSRFGWPR